MPDETMNYVVIEPVINEAAVQAYADKYRTKAPWVHVEGRLHALSSIAKAAEEADEYMDAVERWEHLTGSIERLHREASETFLRMFGEE